MQHCVSILTWLPFLIGSTTVGKIGNSLGLSSALVVLTLLDQSPALYLSSLRAESARAVTGRRWPHSGVGQDGAPHENGRHSETKSRRIDPKVPQRVCLEASPPVVHYCTLSLSDIWVTRQSACLLYTSDAADE